jgi:HD-like signal output (HDOD) protein
MRAPGMELLRSKISNLDSLPAMPSILQSLSECLSEGEDLKVDRVVELISYDKSIASQCLKMANSALFRRRNDVGSVRDAVVFLGMSRIRDLVYSCALPRSFSGSKFGMAAPVFWRHALGTALVSQHLAQRLAIRDTEKFYLAGLLHDLGILVNSILFPQEFLQVLQVAEKSERPLHEVELEMLGFSHSESGRILGDRWHLHESICGAIEFHHQREVEGAHAELISAVSLADLLCRLRDLGYGYYEAREFDLAAEPAWQLLQKRYPAAASLDLALFTFELDERATEVHALVDSIFSGAAVPQ